MKASLINVNSKVIDLKLSGGLIFKNDTFLGQHGLKSNKFRMEQ